MLHKLRGMQCSIHVSLSVLAVTQDRDTAERSVLWSFNKHVKSAILCKTVKQGSHVEKPYITEHLFMYLENKNYIIK